MDILNDNFILFDFYMPMYNWFFPYEAGEDINCNNMDILNQCGTEPENRSLYFHIPFCEDICAFCPFLREVCTDNEVIEKYVDALVKEINIKASYKNIKKHPISSIFFGGGTPSILKPNQILKIGKAIKDNFDLSSLKEFSFEMNAKSITIEKIKALKDIGVTHGRMGVQTFNPKYREMFKLSATVQQIHDGAKLLNDNFNYVCVDMLYGMHGQTMDDFIKDLHHVLQLNTKTIDVYPINNLVTQRRLNESYKKHNLKPTSGLNKFSMNVLLKQYMKSNGYLPHNGHGYIKVNKNLIKENPVVVDRYTFQYHETVYGYKGHEVIGFGCNAISLFDDGYRTQNCTNIKKYINNLLENDNIELTINKYDKKICESKGISLHLPYHGYVDKKKININLVDKNILKNLNTLISKDLVKETYNSYQLTELGWLWYVNLLYYLSPYSDQKAISNRLEHSMQDKNKFVEQWSHTLDLYSK